jgi:hypothetical protein
MTHAKLAFAVVRVVFHLVTLAYGIETTDIHIPNPPKREYSAESVHTGMYSHV